MRSFEELEENRDERLVFQAGQEPELVEGHVVQTVSHAGVGANAHWSYCTCGWATEPTARRDRAELAAVEHLADLRERGAT